MTVGRSGSTGGLTSEVALASRGFDHPCGRFRRFVVPDPRADRGTTWMRIVKAVLLVVAAVLTFELGGTLLLGVVAVVNLPTILYSLQLIIVSPVVSGKVDPVTGAGLSMIADPGVDFAVFPLENPGIVSIPPAFFLGWSGSVTGRYARLQVRSLTAVGAVTATRRQVPPGVRSSASP